MRLAELIKQETDSMNSIMIRNFRHELARELPGFVKNCAVRARKISKEEMKKNHRSRVGLRKKDANKR